MATQEAPPAVPPTSPRRPHRRRARWALVLAAVAVLGLVVGLLAWAPWHKVPVPPTAVHAQSPTATSVLVSWTPGKGGATIDRYLILRDGAQMGSVPAAKTSYDDKGLAPGTTYRYAIIAVAGTQRSLPSVRASATTITPSPVGLTAGPVTWTTALFHWSPSPQGPVPDQYVVLSNGAPVASLPGTADSYTATGLDPATSYQYQVAAMWGDHESDPSSAIQLATLDPPLQGDVPIQVKVLSTPGASASLSPGQKWSDTWAFTPDCTAGGCTLKTDGEWAPPNYTAVPFTVTLAPSGAWYAGIGKAPIASCGSVTTTDTVSLRIAADNGAVDNGAWNSWHGTLAITMPYTDAGGGNYCAAQAWNVSVTGTSSATTSS
jgi:Fibronectin type III domain